MNLSGLNVNCKSVRTNHRGNGRLIGRVRARTHVPCLHGEKDGWVTVSREFSGYSKMCNCSFQDTKSACVGVERTQEEKKEKKKGTEGKENPSEIERHFTRQRKSNRFIHREDDEGH